MAAIVGVSRTDETSGKYRVRQRRRQRPVADILILAAFVPLGGPLEERHPGRPVFLLGAVRFTASSVLLRTVHWRLVAGRRAGGNTLGAVAGRALSDLGAVCRGE
jgi:hypothetical protein